MTAEKKKKAQYILDRLVKLEQSQHDLMSSLQSSHDDQMSHLRQQLQDAQQKCHEATSDTLIEVKPVLMQVDMTEVDAAVQAASYAEQESTQALEEAKKVLQDARQAASSTYSNHHALLKSASDSAASTTKPHFHITDANNEYIVKKVSVNLDEVERVISSSTYVHVCRAFGLPDPKYGNEVFCAVVPKKNVKVSEPMLFIHAQKYLPTAMVPKRFYFVTDLPVGITRKALADTHMAGDLDRNSAANPNTSNSMLPSSEPTPLIGN